MLSARSRSYTILGSITWKDLCYNVLRAGTRALGGGGPAAEASKREEDMERIIVTGSQVHSETRFHFEVSIDVRSPRNNRPATEDDPSTVLNVPRKIGSLRGETENDR